MNRRYYFAAPYSRHPEMRECRTQLVAAIPTVTVTSRWIDCHDGALEQSYTPEVLAAEPDRCWVHGAADLADIIAADTLVSFTGAGGKGGRHIEHGYALALEKRIVIIGLPENIFHCHPWTERYDTWAEFLASEAEAAVR